MHFKISRICLKPFFPLFSIFIFSWRIPPTSLLPTGYLCRRLPAFYLPPSSRLKCSCISRCVDVQQSPWSWAPSVLTTSLSCCSFSLIFLQPTQAQNLSHLFLPSRASSNQWIASLDNIFHCSSSPLTATSLVWVYISSYFSSFFTNHLQWSLLDSYHCLHPQLY